MVTVESDAAIIRMSASVMEDWRWSGKIEEEGAAASGWTKMDVGLLTTCGNPADAIDEVDAVRL